MSPWLLAHPEEECGPVLVRRLAKPFFSSSFPREGISNLVSSAV